MFLSFGPIGFIVPYPFFAKRIKFIGGHRFDIIADAVFRPHPWLIICAFEFNGRDFSCCDILLFAHGIVIRFYRVNTFIVIISVVFHSQKLSRPYGQPHASHCLVSCTISIEKALSVVMAVIFSSKVLLYFDISKSISIGTDVDNTLYLIQCTARGEQCDYGDCEGRRCDSRANYPSPVDRAINAICVASSPNRRHIDTKLNAQQRVGRVITQQ